MVLGRYCACCYGVDGGYISSDVIRQSGLDLFVFSCM